MGARGRRHATTCFSADGAASARIEVYRSLLSTQALSGKREAGWPGVAPAAVRDKRRLPEKPFLNVRMDVTNTCNLKCRMCYFSLPGHKTIDGSPPRHMPLPLLEKIARDVFPHARHLALSCGAESLMYPHFDLFLQLVSASHIQSTELITNAQLLDERRSRLLIDARLTRLSVSIDAATPGTYEHIRQGARFERLVDNIHTLQRLKKELASNVPALHLQYVLMRSNIEELPRAVELAKELGAQSFSCMHMAPIHGLDVVGESLYHHKELANCKLDEASAVAKKLMLPAVFPEKFGAAPGKSTSSAARAKCPYDPWHFLFITESGIAYPCGWLTKQTVAGNFTTQYLEDIWFGEEYERLRREIQTGDLREKCLQCPATAAGDVNDPDAFSER